jgi:hypothetical protein
MKFGMTFIFLCGVVAQAGQWTVPVEVRHGETLCLTYSAHFDGELLIVSVDVQPGWHTFAMDNKQRAEEKLAGKRALSNDLPTSFTLSGGLETVGTWYQSPPKDFSKPELRWFSWGFDKRALFFTKVRKSGAGPAKIAVRAQACTDAICKNIDIAFSLPLSDPGLPGVYLKDLVPVISSR